MDKFPNFKFEKILLIDAFVVWTRIPNLWRLVNGSVNHQIPFQSCSKSILKLKFCSNKMQDVFFCRFFCIFHVIRRLIDFQCNYSRIRIMLKSV